jgi:MtN3 and saliva related transmembrane protein
VIGLCAVVVNFLCYIPQIVQLYRTRSGEDVSRGTFALFAINSGLMLTYGILQHDATVMATSGSSLFQNLLILALRWYLQAPSPS